MATTHSGDTKCEYCWRPANYRPHPEEGLHNEGCPAGSGVNPERALEEWQAGYHFGFQDNYIQWWQYRYYSRSFLLGWRAGKNEIDCLVDQAAQSNYGNYDGWED